MAIRKKEYQEKSVYEASLERIEYIFNSFDKVIVSFSAGKDSTVVLNLALEVARKLNKLPLEVHFFDEEAIHPPTIEYAQRVYENKEELDFKWYCLEVKHRNACSNSEPFWYCWDRDKKDLWVREMPPHAITEHKNFEKGISFQDFSDVIFDVSDGRIAIMTGVRTQESFRRLKAVSSKKNDNYIASINGSNAYKCHPIYDWSSEDVWLAVHKFGWDYNKTYDVFNKTKIFNKFLGQRVCAPFGEEPLRILWIYPECFPEMWHKMLSRVDGVATAWRYSNTELYGIGAIEKPDEVRDWKEFVSIIIDSYSGKEKTKVTKNINSIIKRHYDKTNDALPDNEPHPLTGTSWAFIAKIAIKGDFKGRTAPALEGNAITARKKLGIASYKDAIKIYGKQKK